MSVRDERRTLLLEAARDLVIRHGYRKTSLEDVAQAAGMSRATIYNYFANKEEVFRSLIALEIERLTVGMAEAIDPADPPELRLLAAVRARYARFRQIKDLYSVARNVSRDVLPIATAEFEAFQALELAFIEGLLREGVASGRFVEVDPEVLAPALLSALRGLDEAFVFDDREALAQGAECLLQTLFSGLLA